MRRAILNLQDQPDYAPCRASGVSHQASFLASPMKASSPRLKEGPVCSPIMTIRLGGVPVITPGRSHGFTFAWYRIKVTLPETVQGQDIRGVDGCSLNLR